MRNAMVVLIAAVAAMAGCGRSADVAAITSEVRALHRAAVEAHLKKDVGFLTRNYAERYFAVRDGEVSFPGRRETAAGLADYLNNTTFSEYRELAEPMVGCSRDGSLVWAVGRVKVKGVRRTADGSQRPVDFTCAWLTLYERRGGELVRLGDVSTFK
jgi:hypothetical protein